MSTTPSQSTKFCERGPCLDRTRCVLNKSCFFSTSSPVKPVSFSQQLFGIDAEPIDFDGEKIIWEDVEFNGQLFERAIYDFSRGVLYFEDVEGTRYDLALSLKITPTPIY